jgi:bifunctional DNA-binding transcriptional regulator/antitoxin component of YhaV-PrlF toxin-antitoxin module
MRISSKGQVTIPQEVRHAAGLLPNCEVGFKVVGSKVFLFKVAGNPRRGKSIVQQLRGKGTIKMSTDEIMALTRGA